MIHSDVTMIRLAWIVGPPKQDEVMAEKTLFSSADLGQHLGQQRYRVDQALQNYDPDELLGASEADLVEYFVALGRVDEVVLHRDQAYMLDPEEFLKESRDRFDLAVGVSHRRVTRWTLIVPFTGNPEIFNMRASTWSSAPPRASIVSYELRIYYDTDYGPSGAEQIRAFFDSRLASIEKSLGFAHTDIANYNRALESEMPGKVAARRAKHLADKQLQADLGYPIIQRSDAASYAVPVQRRQLTPKRPNRPAPTGQAFQPEPRLADADYEEALAVLLNSRNAIERSPSTAAKLNEEEIRDLLLINLNARFEGKAAGEVFNGRGKTDILIRDDDRNVFIGECKFWGGPKKFTDAVDQLLTYATWRDTKAALLIFVRGGNFTAITDKAVKALEAHPNYKRRGQHASEDRHDFVLHANGDTNREIKLALMLFLISESTAATSDEQ